MKWGILMLLSLVSACKDSGAEPKLVDVSEIDPSFVLDVRYAGKDNFVGGVIDGYEAVARCMLTPAAANALASAQRSLRDKDLGLLLYDCYRPQRAVDHFVRWAKDLGDQRNKARFYPNVPKSELLPRGYIAARSSHSRGSTVDAGLIHLAGPEEGQPVDMGTEFDVFDPKSHTDAPGITAFQRQNRGVLLEVMVEAGFANLPVEWWHYTLKQEPYPDTYFDFVVR